MDSILVQKNDALDTTKVVKPEPIKTIVFYDLETTGLIKTWSFPQTRYLTGTNDSNSIQAELNTFLATVKRNAALCPPPRITEIALCAVSRSDFESKNYTMSTIQKKTFSTIVNPNLDVNGWNNYEIQQKQKPAALVYTREELVGKNKFDDVWKNDVAPFLESLPKPLCLGMFSMVVIYIAVAHNGVFFDNPVLFLELARCNLTFSFRSQIFFVDSLLAFKYIDRMTTENIRESIKYSTCETFFYLDEWLIGNSRQKNELMDSLDTKDWSPVFKSRINRRHFVRSIKTNEWTFKPSGKYKLGVLYGQINNTGLNFHHAGDDVIALGEICLSYGESFLEYMDKAAFRM